MSERLQKILSRAGVASRRRAEELMLQGRVSVDGRVVTELGTRVDPDTAIVRVDGERLVTRPGAVHLALNKPRGVHSTMSDDRGRPCVGDYLADHGAEGLFHVGRLDADTEGLLLLTNDGELGHRLAHPSYEVRKTYVAEVAAPVQRGLAATLRRGVTLDDGPARADSVRVLESAGDRALLEIVLHEGRNRIVRRMLDAVGHPVRRLVRTAVGDVRLGEQRPGTVRELTRAEIAALYRAVGM